MPSDAEIKHAVLHELKWDTRVGEEEVGVEVDRGIVTLTGTVGSYAKKLAAQEAAHQVAAVRDVVNDLQVTVPGRVARSDTAIAQMVRRMLAWDERVPDTHIDTTVADGWVTLQGHVDVWAQRLAAERALRHLAGVRGVTNHLVVQAPRVEPQHVRHEIERALKRRAAHKVTRLEVTVTNGIVTLAGAVRSWPEKQALLAAVGHAPGVQGVQDQLRIDAST
jgi:osmotically-inducible protein OsmY